MRGQIEHEKLRKLEFEIFFFIFLCLVQSEVKKIILVKSSLRVERFKPCKMIFM